MMRLPNILHYPSPNVFSRKILASRTNCPALRDHGNSPIHPHARIFSHQRYASIPPTFSLCQIGRQRIKQRELVSHVSPDFSPALCGRDSRRTCSRTPRSPYVDDTADSGTPRPSTGPELSQSFVGFLIGICQSRQLQRNLAQRPTQKLVPCWHHAKFLLDIDQTVFSGTCRR